MRCLCGRELSTIREVNAKLCTICTTSGARVLDVRRSDVGVPENETREARWRRKHYLKRRQIHRDGQRRRRAAARGVTATAGVE